MTKRKRGTEREGVIEEHAEVVGEREMEREGGEKERQRERDERKRHDDTVICAEGERE